MGAQSLQLPGIGLDFWWYCARPWRVLINLVTTVQTRHPIPFNAGTKRAASDIRLGILNEGQEIRSHASERERTATALPARFSGLGRAGPVG